MPLTARLPIQIRFSDVDSLGHVNNAFYLSYFELARMELFRISGLKIDWRKTGIILARVEIDYVQPILLHDKVEVICTPGKTGNKSFELLYELISVRNNSLKTFSKGKSIQVCFDYERLQSVPIPEDWRKALNH